MEKYFAVLEKCPLFAGISVSELKSLLNCLSAKAKTYIKGEFIFLAGDPAKYVGIVLDGSVQVVREDLLGNSTILAGFQAGEMFGESFSFSDAPALSVSVVADSNSTIMLLDCRRIIETCPSSCMFHQRLIENMLQIIAKKNLYLNQKNEILSARSTRKKLMTYFSMMAVNSSSPTFTILFNRQELADYLAVDRSAMCLELSKMKHEGLLDFRKNKFTLLGHEYLRNFA